MVGSSTSAFCTTVVCHCWQGTNNDELDMEENEQLEVVESEGDGWMRVCTRYYFSCILYVIETFVFFLRTKLCRGLSIDSENWHAKTVDPSEQSKLSPVSITVFYHCNLIMQIFYCRA